MQFNLYENHSFYLRARIVSLIVNIIGIIFFSAATALQAYFYTDGFGQFADGLQLAPFAYSLLWTGIFIGLHLANKRYHPGIDVAFDLIAVLLACGSVWLIIEWTATIGDYYQNCYEDDCTPTSARALKATEVIGIVTLLVSIILHIIFFCQACVAVHKVRRQPKGDRDSFHELREDVELAKK